MIAIVNIGPHRKDDEGGERTYELKINKSVMCRFHHERRDGLSACLRKAADALDEKSEKQAADMMAFFRKSGAYD